MSPLDRRPWAGPADTAAMRALVSERMPADWPATRLHPGDVDWWEVIATGRGRSVHEIARLWFDGAGLAAYAWFGVPGDLDLVVRLDVSPDAVAADAFTWAEDRAAVFGPALEPGARPSVRAWAREGWDEAAAFAALGLVAGEVGFVHLTAEIAGLDLAPVPLPPGMEERALTPADIASRVACGRAAFHSSMTVEAFQFARTRPTYRPDLDTLLVDDRGEVAAFALGWLDPATRILELEPVAVHPDRHRQGLGRAVCRAAIRRGAAAGATRVVIGAEADNPASVGLYRALGLEITTRFVPYTR